MTDATIEKNNAPDTWFAPAARADETMLRWSFDTALNSPVVDALMHTVGGILAVLNEERQFVVVNKTALECFGVDSMEELLGKRIGEVIGCKHAEEPPHGCGTTKYCSTCGAAIATVASLAQMKPCERNCAVVIEKDGLEKDLAFSIRASPIECSGKVFVLLFMEDTTDTLMRASMDRAFYHDLNNIVSGLSGLSDGLAFEESAECIREPVLHIHRLSRRLSREIEIQQSLASAGTGDYNLVLETVSMGELLNELNDLSARHPCAQGRTMEVADRYTGTAFTTDRVLFMRVITNMVINAFEFTDAGQAVKFWMEEDADEYRFSVWNHRAIPEDVQLRIFQRNFTTRDDCKGHGLGTYSMKLFGESYLGGKVTFTSTEEEGTCFRLVLPVEPPK